MLSNPSTIVPMKDSVCEMLNIYTAPALLALVSSVSAPTMRKDPSLLNETL